MPFPDADAPRGLLRPRCREGLVTFREGLVSLVCYNCCRGRASIVTDGQRTEGQDAGTEQRFWKEKRVPQFTEDNQHQDILFSCKDPR